MTQHPFETRLLLRYENLHSFTFRGSRINSTPDELMDVAEALNSVQIEPATEIIRVQSFFLGS